MKLSSALLLVMIVGACGCAAPRHHTPDPSYLKDGFTRTGSGEYRFICAPESVTLRIDQDLDFVGQYRDGKAGLAAVSSQEKKRIRQLLRKFVETYLRHYASCSLVKDSRWELVIEMAPHAELELDGGYRVNDMLSDGATVDVGRHSSAYPVVSGTYRLVDRKNGAEALRQSVSGTGSAIDTAIDDFARNLVRDLAANMHADGQ